jgi:hypothetical protein
MEQKLDFSLPSKAEKKSRGHIVGFALILVSIWLAILSPYILPKSRTASEAAGSDISFQQAQDLAGKLASRGLYDRAASVLEDAASRTKLQATDLAKLYYQVAEYLAEGGKYDGAVEYYYRSEMFDKVVDEQQMNARLKECFERMGKFSALDREIASRTSMKGAKEPDSPVVAEIGTEKITAQKLDDMIEQQIEDQMSRYAAFMKPEQISERKKEMVRQFTEPKTREKFLEGWLGQEVLYRQAMAKGLADKPEVKRMMETMSKGLAAEQAMNEEVAAKVTITETDARTWYEAHKSQYVEQGKDPNSPPVQKSYDEAKDAVYQQLHDEKTRDVQQAYIKQLMDKFNVVVHTSAFGQGSAPNAAAGEKSK